MKGSPADSRGSPRFLPPPYRRLGRICSPGHPPPLLLVVQNAPWALMAGLMGEPPLSQRRTYGLVLHAAEGCIRRPKRYARAWHCAKPCPKVDTLNESSVKPIPDGDRRGTNLIVLGPKTISSGTFLCATYLEGVSPLRTHPRRYIAKLSQSPDPSPQVYRKLSQNYLKTI